MDEEYLPATSSADIGGNLQSPESSRHPLNEKQKKVKESMENVFGKNISPLQSTTEEGIENIQEITGKFGDKHKPREN